MSRGSRRKGLAKPKAGGGVPEECQTQGKGSRLVWSGHAVPCRLGFFMMSANLQDSFLELHSVTYNRHHNIRFTKMSAYGWKGREGGWRDKTIYWQNNKRKINLYDRWASEIYSVIRKHRDSWFAGKGIQAALFYRWKHNRACRICLLISEQIFQHILLKWIAKMHRS